MYPSPPLIGASDAPDMSIFNNLRFVSMNVRSFNASDYTFNTAFNKIDLLIKLHPDFLFLSETKICSNSQKNAIRNFLKFNKEPYEIIFNSSSSSRGCAIAYKSSLPLKVIETFPSDDENFLVMNATFTNTPVTIAVMYGPNNNNSSVFRSFKNVIDRKYEAMLIMLT